MKQSEKQLQSNIITFFKKYFYIYAEVWSTDNKKRIDLVMIHHSDKDREYPIGVEIKLKDKKTGRSLGHWIKQASEYSTKDFKEFGKCLIITCPQISGLYMKEGTEVHNHETETDFGYQNNVSTFIGQFGLGELQKYDWYDKTKYRIVFKGAIIWDMQDDILRMHNYKRLVK